MDVDNSDVEGQLLRQFSSLGTTDKEVLIAELQKLVGNQLNTAGCAFFLDMNDWNLQAAVGSYFDYEQPSVNLRVPMMCLVKDATVGEGESVPPNTRFMKTWRVKNNGSECWPPGCCLKFISGDQLTTQDRVMVDALDSGQCMDISIEMLSPAATGIYQGQWRMQTTIGLYFGEVIWVILSVEENGLLGVTQQLSQFGGDFANAQPHQPTQNPFASPRKMDLEELPPQPAPAATMCSASFGCLQPGGMAASPRAVQGSFNSVMAGDIHTTTVTASHVRAALFQNSTDPSIAAEQQDTGGAETTGVQEVDMS